jgi:subtilisin family serine protease
MTLVGDYSGVDRVPMDVVGHGTACAGIIGAAGRRLPRGLAGAARVLPMRALAGAQFVGRPTMTALGSLVDIDLAVKMAIDLGARVLNLSFGTPEGSLRPRDPRPHAAVVEYARRRGCVLVAASGNSGTAARYYPACLDGVIAVGSVGADGTPSSFSTRGDHVDLCAPGERIPSSGIGGYQHNTGTSFAAPFVAAACALLLARAARYSEAIDGDAVRDLLRRHAAPFPRGAEADGCGTGILDVPAALRALESAISQSPDQTPEEAPPDPATPVRETRATMRAP